MGTPTRAALKGYDNDDKRIRELIENMTGKEIFHLLAYRPRLLEKFREVILSSYDIVAALEHRRALGD